MKKCAILLHKKGHNNADILHNSAQQVYNMSIKKGTNKCMKKCTEPFFQVKKGRGVSWLIMALLNSPDLQDSERLSCEIRAKHATSAERGGKWEGEEV